MRLLSARVIPLISLACLVAGAPAVEAQIPASVNEARRLLQEDPERARQLLRQSGLSQAEIRSRLLAEGLPADALDAFLSGAPLDPTTAFTPDAVAGLESLGLAVQGADGLELLELVTGLQDGEAEEFEPSPVFGHDAFRRQSSRFQPLMSGPVSEDYRIGPGDQLLLLLTGEAELAHELSVSREGFVVVPEAGRVNVANLTMSELRTLLRSRLSSFYSGIERGTTDVAVSITGLRAIQIYVVGEVEQAGAFQLASVATVTNALYAAGGPTNLGNLRGVRVERRNGDVFLLDLYPYLLAGDASGDVTLEEGDVIFVPLSSRRVYVEGAVARPKQYELVEGDDLADVLVAAGGFDSDADRSRITVHRVLRPGDRGPGLGDRAAIDLGLAPSSDVDDPNHLGGVTVPPVGLQDGDSIVVGHVPTVAEGYHVSVSGMVARPDTFPWREGMTLRDLVRLARGPVVGADLREAEVSRLPDQRRIGELADRIRVPLDSSYLTQRSADGRYVGPPGVVFPPSGSSPEFPLLPYDQVVILRQPEFEMPSSVVVTGQVSVPGRYTLLTKDDRVTDLVQRAQGMLESGYADGARLYRSLDDMGRIDLDLSAAIGAPESDENIVLQPGDSLHIPEYSPTVNIQGAVNSPVTVLWRNGQDFDYYIAAAGGFRSDADEGRTSVRFANGLARTRSKFLFWSSYPTPRPGSTITVPRKDPDDRIDKVQLTSNLVAILGSLATLVIVIDRSN